MLFSPKPQNKGSVSLLYQRILIFVAELTLLLNEALVSAPELKHLKSTVVLLYTEPAVHKGSNLHKHALTKTVVKPHVISQLFFSLSSCLTHFTLQTSLFFVSASFCLCFLFSNALSIIENISAVNKWKVNIILFSKFCGWSRALRPHLRYKSRCLEPVKLTHLRLSPLLLNHWITLIKVTSE